MKQTLGHSLCIGLLLLITIDLVRCDDSPVTSVQVTVREVISFESTTTPLPQNLLPTTSTFAPSVQSLGSTTASPPSPKPPVNIPQLLLRTLLNKTHNLLAQNITQLLPRPLLIKLGRTTQSNADRQAKMRSPTRSKRNIPISAWTDRLGHALMVNSSIESLLAHLPTSDQINQDASYAAASSFDI